MGISKEDFFWKLIHSEDFEYYIEHGSRNPNGQLSVESMNLYLKGIRIQDTPFISEEMQKNINNAMLKYSKFIDESINEIGDYSISSLKTNLKDFAREISCHYYKRGLMKFLLRDFAGAERDREKSLEFIIINEKKHPFQFGYSHELKWVRIIEKKRKGQQADFDLYEQNKFYKSLCGCQENPCVCNFD